MNNLQFAAMGTDTHATHGRPPRWAGSSAAILLVWAAACDPTLPAGASRDDATLDADGTGPVRAPDGADEGGLPCDVEQFLTTRCATCHSAKPVGGAPMPLVTYADLVRPSTSDPSRTVAQASLSRAENGRQPMPPASLLPSAEVAPLAKWVRAGAPKGKCEPIVAGAARDASADASECLRTKDCPSPLICKKGLCDVECVADVDCAPSLTCQETRCLKRLEQRDASTQDDAATDAGAD
jgi:mono/diheme cytochrome c family protein